MEYKVYAKDNKEEYTMCYIHQQIAEILSDEKDKVEEVQQLASFNVA